MLLAKDATYLVANQVKRDNTEENIEAVMGDGTEKRKRGMIGDAADTIVRIAGLGLAHHHLAPSDGLSVISAEN